MDAVEPQAAPRSRAWIGRAAFEATLIVLGLVGALVVDEWRDTRERNDRVRSALASIRAELEANQDALDTAIANHQNVIGRLRESAKTGVIYQGGIISGAPFSAVAWDAARDAAITNDIDHQTLMSLGHAYGTLTAYLDGRKLFSNFLYTNDTQALRGNPLGLAGWLSDLTRNAQGVKTAVAKAIVTLDSAEQGHEQKGDAENGRNENQTGEK
jgi:hypothetical protein